MKKIFVLSLLLILTGCGSVSGRYGELPALNDKEMAGNIVVVRISSFFGVLVGWQIDIDGNELFGIGSGEYTEFLLPEGEHYITLRCSQPFLSPMPGSIKYEDTIKFFVENSQTIYFLFSPSLKCGKIKLSDEIEAKKHIERSKFINLETQITQ